jgi:hypothetical protein
VCLRGDVKSQYLGSESGSGVGWAVFRIVVYIYRLLLHAMISFFSDADRDLENQNVF